MRFLVTLAAAAALLVAPAAQAAPQTEVIFEANNSAETVSVTFDNVTGEISGLSWVLPAQNPGVLTMTVQRAGQPDLTFTRTSSGSIAVPSGRFFLVQDRRGGWSWRGTAYSIGWHP